MSLPPDWTESKTILGNARYAGPNDAIVIVRRDDVIVMRTNAPVLLTILTYHLARS